MTPDIYMVGDETTIHVYEGMKCMGIYDRETGAPRFITGFHRLDNQVTTDGADRDGDITANLKAVNLDKEWARNRNKTIENEIKELREILDYNSTELKPERVKNIEEEIESLLEERDKNTYMHGLAGKEFERLYLEKQHRPEEPKDYSHKPNGDEARFKKITKEMLNLYSRKNTDYGGSFDESLDEDGLLVSKIRLKDKFNRFAQLIENDALVNDESMRDTLIDMANYAVMTLMWLDSIDMFIRIDDDEKS